MEYKMIATWAMAYEGVKKGCNILDQGGTIYDAVEQAVMVVEDTPYFTSVGTGGLPNRDGQVELDAAFMDGSTLDYGGVMAVRHMKNPIRAARMLSRRKRNMLLVSDSAESYGAVRNLVFDNLLTDYAREKWRTKKLEDFESEKLEAYDGHDTVCMLAIDGNGNICAGASTSGLFMKSPGRVGDSPIIGSGIYCDNLYGGAAATGVGEDIMKGCLSHEIVMLMKYGMSPQEACEKALFSHRDNLLRKGHTAGSMAVIAIDMNGNTGAATTAKEFPVVCGWKDEVEIRLTNVFDGVLVSEPASAEWIAEYDKKKVDYIGS